MGRCLRLALVMFVVAPLLLGDPLSPTTVFAQRAKIEPAQIALQTTDLPPDFTVTKEDTKPMDPGPGVLYVRQMERPITDESLASGPVMVAQLIGRFDGSVSYEGFLDGLRQKAIESEGFETVPGAPNDGGTSSLQKFEKQAAMYEVGFIKRDMVIFTRWVGHRDVVSLQGVLTLAGVSSARYDQILVGGSPAPSGDPVAAAPTQPTEVPSSTVPPTRKGRIGNTGGTGANLRTNPSSTSELVKVLAEGEEVTLIGVEETGPDGRRWRNVRTSTGEAGWVVAEYVSTGVQVAAAPPPAPATSTPTPAPSAPPARATPTATPSRQDAVSKPAGTIDSRVQPALRVLYGIRKGPSGGMPWGDYYRAIVERSGVSIGLARMPANAGGYFVGRDNAITLNAAMLEEDNRTVASTLSHELQHVAQSISERGQGLGCVEREVDAFKAGIVTWVLLWDPLAPGRTSRERFGNAMAQRYVSEGDPWLYKYVVDTDGYQDQCKLWVP